MMMYIKEIGGDVDWLQSLKQFFINVSYHILVASLTLMIRVRLVTSIYATLMKNVLWTGASLVVMVKIK